MSGFIFPNSIEFRLDITLNRRNYKDESDNSVLINDENSYSEIERIAEEKLKELCSAELTDKDHYLRHGSCKIITEGANERVHSLVSLEDWKSICQIILKQCVSKNRRNFRLDISREFATLQSEAFNDENIATTKLCEINDLLKESSEPEKLYLPKPDIIRVASNDTIRQIIEQDRMIDEKDKKSFTKDVQKKGKILLLSCVLARLSMKHLKHLFDAGFSDKSLPLEEKQCCHATNSECRANFREIVQRQNRFMAPEITSEYTEYQSSVVMPIRYWCKPGTEYRGTDGLKKSARCGDGGYSDVYRIKINPNHHKFSQDRDAVFALKVIRKNRPETDSNFKDELKILEELRRYPHDDMVTHLAAWTHNETNYMLFPCAECNLREYMEQQTFDIDSKEAILQLLSQLRGLAHALRDLHNFADMPETDPPSNCYKSGWHHDVKPENILYFPNTTSVLGTLRIADFGLGRISECQSKSVYTRNQKGTPTYEPPEAHGNGPRSRPYDIWSLGCVFLELLVWAYFGSQEVENFGKERQGRRAPDSIKYVIEDNAFWQMKKNGTPHFRSVVEIKLEQLREKVRHQEAQPFQGVLKLVEKMLVLEPKDRIIAIMVLDTLERINSQMAVDLSSTRSDSPTKSNNNKGLPLPRLSLQIPKSDVSSTSSTPHLSDTASSEENKYVSDEELQSPSSYDHREVN